MLALRRGLVLAAAGAAATALMAGLARLGVEVGWGPPYATEHGPLFVLGAFVTLIGLERAVALGRAWAYCAPASSALSGLAMLARSSSAALATVAASALLVAINVAIVRRQSAPFTWLMLAGSAVLAVGNLAWAAGRPVPLVVEAWIGFFVLTIVAERLELSRLRPTPGWAGRVVVALAGVLAVSACACALGSRGATRPLGVALGLLALWQLRFDLARATIRTVGLPRFAAAGVLAGASWLLAAGVLFASGRVPVMGPVRDAALHAVFLGYVMSMVFAHAPIIFPAVARFSLPFSRALYAPLGALHAGLVVRVGGDLAGSAELRSAGGVLNALAILLFATTVAAQANRHRFARR